ncbi:WGxxGxxG family protein [Methylobacterium durans]|nr:WGxxGxxG family protein [Methylobacterium durans]
MALALATAAPALAQNTTANPGAPSTANPPTHVADHDDSGKWGWLGLLGLIGLAGLMPRKDRVAARTTLDNTSGAVRR